MWKSLLPLCLTAMLTSGCAQIGAVQSDQGYCALYKPVLLTEAEITSLNSDTKRTILRNNEVYRELGCKAD